MKILKCLALAAVAGFFIAVASPSAKAVDVHVNIGVAPVCPYGYYDYPPYDCAPYGYYGPEWFVNGFFIGAGPWFHGPREFHGHVDNHFDRRHGYRGELPHHGSHAERGRRPWENHGFHGNEMRDGRGHEEHPQEEHHH